MYNYINAGKVLEFELYNMTATKLVMIYERILKYSELQVFAEHNRLYIIKSQNLKIIVE